MFILIVVVVQIKEISNKYSLLFYKIQKNYKIIWILLIILYFL